MCILTVTRFPDLGSEVIGKEFHVDTVVHLNAELAACANTYILPMAMIESANCGSHPEGEEPTVMVLEFQRLRLRKGE